MSKYSPRTLNEMVEEQIRRWRAAQRERRESHRPPRPRPLITISREAASGGTDVGRLVAHQLGFSFWDQELVHEIAARSRISQKLVESLDERERTMLEELVSATLTGEGATQHNYLRELHRLIRTMKEHGGAVIIGRGAQFIINATDCLRVRVICPLERRVESFARKEGMPRTEAEAKIREVEQSRRAFIAQHFEKEVSDPSHYDVMINTGSLSLERAAEVIAAAYRARFAPSVAQTIPEGAPGRQASLASG